MKVVFVPIIGMLFSFFFLNWLTFGKVEVILVFLLLVVLLKSLVYVVHEGLQLLLITFEDHHLFLCN